MNITLHITSHDYGFIVEAIKLRTTAIIESFEMDKQAAEQADHETNVQASNEVRKMVDKIFEQELAQQKPKKPHWTQTPKGKKIMAARKRSKK